MSIDKFGELDENKSNQTVYKVNCVHCGKIIEVISPRIQGVVLSVKAHDTSPLLEIGERQEVTKLKCSFCRNMQFIEFAFASTSGTTFDVILMSTGTQKISVIKIVREITGLNLTEAKELVDSTPKLIKEGISKDETEAIRKWFESTDAIIDIKKSWKSI